MIDLKTKTKTFALQSIKLYAALPKTTEAQVLGKQILRSRTSVGAHYRKGSMARSDAEFISKLEGDLQDLEETSYWLKLFVESGIVTEINLADLMKEVDELTTILVTCVKNTRIMQVGKK